MNTDGLELGGMRSAITAGYSFYFSQGGNSNYITVAVAHVKFPNC